MVCNLMHTYSIYCIHTDYMYINLTFKDMASTEILFDSVDNTGRAIFPCSQVEQLMCLQASEQQGSKYKRPVPIFRQRQRCNVSKDKTK